MFHHQLYKLDQKLKEAEKIRLQEISCVFCFKDSNCGVIDLRDFMILGFYDLMIIGQYSKLATGNRSLYLQISYFVTRTSYFVILIETELFITKSILNRTSSDYCYFRKSQVYEHEEMDTAPSCI